MKNQNIPFVRLAFIASLLAASMSPALAADPTPHIYNRGVHGHFDLASAEHLLTVCPRGLFSQLYLGNGQAKDQLMMQSGIVPGGHYGRQDRARFERCAHRFTVEKHGVDGL